MKILPTFLLLIFLCTNSIIYAQDHSKLPEKEQNNIPQKTEIWEPIPPIVTPGLFHSPPSDAIVLFDGKNLDAWANNKKGPSEWTVAEGTVTVKPGTGELITKQGFQDIQLHMEWKAPGDSTGLVGQDRSNSGVFLQSKYEVQILDSYKNRTYSNGQAGAVYKQHIPLANACRPPGEWQTYDIIFTAPRFNKDGSVKTPAYFTVFHNGVLLQNHVEVKGTTTNVGEPVYTAHEEKLPFFIQDHGNFMSFRNIWVRELK